MSRATILPLALALLLGSPALAAEKGHPDVGPDRSLESCEGCHAEATPQVVKEWEGSKHGLVLVKCLVCHGSTGKDFVVRTKAARCAGCHPVEAAAVVPAKAAKAKGKAAAEPPAAECFACHAPHSLETAPGAANPHAAR
jgi:hypothetical protein